MKLKGKKVAIFVEQLYQDLEVWVPYYRLKEEGAECVLVGTGSAALYAGKYGYPAKVDAEAGALRPELYDGVVIPGGWAPDFLRRSAEVCRFVRAMDECKKIVASICHGGWVLVSAGMVRGRTLTSFIAIRDDLQNAGAKFVDRPLVRDHNLITSRAPDDLPAHETEDRFRVHCFAQVGGPRRGVIGTLARTGGRGQGRRPPAAKRSRVTSRESRVGCWDRAARPGETLAAC